MHLSIKLSKLYFCKNILYKKVKPDKTSRENVDDHLQVKTVIFTILFDFKNILRTYFDLIF